MLFEYTVKFDNLLFLYKNIIIKHKEALFLILKIFTSMLPDSSSFLYLLLLLATRKLRVLNKIENQTTHLFETAMNN